MNVLFFASLREQLQCAQTQVPDLPCGSTVRELMQHLVARGEPWSSAFADARVLAAVNQEMVSLDTPVQAGDEVAFFPPVTGG